MIKKPINVLTKIGTDINELLEIADMKKRGAKYGVFQDASLTYNRHSREWEIYHGW